MKTLYSILNVESPPILLRSVLVLLLVFSQWHLSTGKPNGVDGSAEKNKHITDDLVSIRLLDENGDPLANFEASYRSRCGGTWAFNDVPFTTDAEGYALVNTSCENNNWDGKITVFVNQTSREQTVATNNTYRVAKVNVILKTCEDTPLEGGIVEQGGGHWVNQGTTDNDGRVSFYAFSSNNVKVRMRYNYGTQTIETSTVVDPGIAIHFVTTKVTIQGSIIQVGSSGWPTTPMPYNMLPGSYNFRIDGTQTNGLEISGCQFDFPTSCAGPSILNQPSNQVITYGESSSFSVTVSNTPSLQYQWEESNDGGDSWAALADNSMYAGVTTSTLTLAKPIVGMSGNKYRVLVTNECGIGSSDGEASLIVSPKNISVQITSENKVFDASTTATAIAVNPPDGLIPGDDVTAMASNGAFADANVGTGKTVTAEISLEGMEAGNYTVNATAVTTADITPAATISTLNNALAACDGTEVTLSVVITTENPAIQSEIDEFGGTVAFKTGTTTVGTVSSSSVEGGIFSGTFTLALQPGISYELSAEFEPFSNNLEGSLALLAGGLIAPEVSITSTVPANSNGNVVLFEGAHQALNLPSSTALVAHYQPVDLTNLTYRWYAKPEGGIFELITGASGASLQVSSDGDYVKEFKVELLVDGSCVGFAEFSKVVSVEASCGNGKGNQQKVQVCHLPPGNPNNRKTICVSVNAVDALLKNSPGSFIGNCSVSYRVAEEPGLIAVPWNTPLELVQKEVEHLTRRWFHEVKAPLKISASDYNPLQPGYYNLRADFHENDQVTIDQPLTIGVVVLDKPLATDIEVSNNFIQKHVSKGFEIGVLKTIDPADDVHNYYMDENPFIQLVNDKLVWMGDMQSPNTIEVFVHSMDRAGQTISKTIKLNRELELDKLVIYPNPSRDETNLLIPLIGESNVSIQVFDTAGRLVYEETTVQQEPFVRNLNLRAFSSGLYQVIVHTGNRIHSGRIVRE